MPTSLLDIFLMEPSVFEDVRGAFHESFNARVFEERTGIAWGIAGMPVLSDKNLAGKTLNGAELFD